MVSCFIRFLNLRVFLSKNWFISDSAKPEVVSVGLLGLAGGPGLGFSFPWNGGIPQPIGLPGASQSTSTQKGTKGTWEKVEKPENA